MAGLPGRSLRRAVAARWCCVDNTAVDVTPLAIAVTVALGVGILILLVSLAVYVQSRRRADQLRRQLITGGVQRRTLSSQVHLPDSTTEAVLQEPRRTAAADGLTKSVSFAVSGGSEGGKGGARPSPPQSELRGPLPLDLPETKVSLGVTVRLG